MNALLVFAVLALASPIFGDESIEEKKQDKRGIVNLGYGGHYPYGAHGLTGYGGYGGYGHGYVAPVYPGLAHGVGHGWNHGIAAAPSIVHGYNAAPIPAIASYSHGYNHHVPSLLTAAPWRLGYNHAYNGVHGAGYSHGLNYGNAW
ncbi:cuticle protein 64-like [Venturia canescens]|uniref:cuticle protein 64-like n=1 Tax=Venturia canescens TaxID=32260 RepID=UPI001C9D2912|nr:cuticle protein 64-like [Venturia canescens]